MTIFVRLIRSHGKSLHSAKLQGTLNVIRTATLVSSREGGKWRTLSEARQSLRGAGWRSYGVFGIVDRGLSSLSEGEVC